MHLIVISPKLCWIDPSSASGYCTDAEFASQMGALSQLFERTTVVMPVHRSAAPDGSNSLEGYRLRVQPLPLRYGRRWPLKGTSLAWLSAQWPTLWRAIRQADAVHVPMSSALGALAIVLTLLQRRPLFAHYGGSWEFPSTTMERLARWLVERIAGGRNVVLATGGGKQPPSACSPHVRWISAASLCQAELEAVPERLTWQPGRTLRLITLGRQEPAQNTEALFRALYLIRQQYPQTTLDVVGDGSCLPRLRRLAVEMGIEGVVFFYGRVDHQTEVTALSRADLFCLPAGAEGFPKAVHEALACGLPVITGPVAVLRQLITSEVGLVLPDASPETIARAVLELSADAQRLGKMARRARSIAREYSLERWRDEIGRHLRAAWGDAALRPLADKQGTTSGDEALHQDENCAGLSSTGGSQKEYEGKF